MFWKSLETASRKSRKWSLAALAMLTACGQSSVQNRSTERSADASSTRQVSRMSVEDVIRSFELGDKVPDQVVSVEDRTAWENSLVAEDKIRPADAIEADPEFQLGDVADNEREIVDLRANDTAVRNQGSEGTCTAFATIGAMENLIKRFYGEAVDISERHHWNTYADYQTTSSLKKASAATIVSEASWPYRGSKPSGSLAALGIAKLDKYSTTKLSLKPVVESLRKGQPVVIAVGVLTSLMNPKEGGIVQGGRQKRGAGHAIALTGAIIDARVPGGGYFIIKNSWGKNWGDNGYGYVAFDYCQRTWCSAYSIADASKYDNGSLVAKPQSSETQPDTNSVTVSKIKPTLNDFELVGHPSSHRGVLGATTYYLSVESSPEIMKQIRSIKYAGDNGNYIVHNGAAEDVPVSIENMSSPDFRTLSQSVDTDDVLVILRDGSEITLPSIKLDL